MRKVVLGQPANDNDTLRWCVDSVREIERASAVENPFDIFAAYVVSNPPTTPVRTLDVATATASDLAAVLGTLIKDMQRRGTSRVE